MLLAFLRCPTGLHSEDILATAERVAGSLGLFDGKPAGFAHLGSALFFQSVDSRASRPIASRRVKHALLLVPESSSGARCLLNGNIDNSDQLSQELGVASSSEQHLYLAAYDKWGDDVDLHIVGDYCSLILAGDGVTVRLARSPWRAPPLHYVHDEKSTIVSSVPRALFAAGFPSELSQQKLVDNMFANLTEDMGWYRGTYRVNIGQSVILAPGQQRKPRRYYDHLAPRETRLPRREDYVAAVDSLLEEAAAAAMRGYSQPGLFLSGGLDSSNMAVRALRTLRGGQKLKSFTFRPHENYRDIESSSNFGDDWPNVQRFAAMHPQLEPHAARATGFDAGWDQMFLAAGVAPVGLPNMAIYEAICKQAQTEGCDVMLDATLGNATFSNSAPWAYTEYLFRGKWKALFHAMTRYPLPWRRYPEHIIRRFFGPLLPHGVWKYWKNFRGSDPRPSNQKISMLRDEAMQRFNVEERARKAHVLYSKPFYASRKQFYEDALGRGDMDGGEINQGFEQIHGFRWRDVTSYRPLVEFCLGLPTEMFVHDRQSRWLARELGKGVMPENQRLESRQGFHNCDWHERITPRLPEIRKELEIASQTPELAAIIDFDRVKETIAKWPDKPSLDDDVFLPFGMALPRAVMMSRFYRFVNGGNSGDSV